MCPEVELQNLDCCWKGFDAEEKNLVCLFAWKGTPKPFLLAELMTYLPSLLQPCLFSRAFLHLQNHFPLSGNAFSIPIPTAMVLLLFEDSQPQHLNAIFFMKFLILTGKTEGQLFNIVLLWHLYFLVLPYLLLIPVFLFQ